MNADVSLSPENRVPGWMAQVVVRAFAILIASVTVCVRFYMRIISPPRPGMRVLKRFRVEDGDSGILLSAQIFTLGYALGGFVALCFGEGYAAWNVTPRQYIIFSKVLYAQSLAYTPAAYFTKTTLLLLILNSFSVYEGVVILLRSIIGALLLGYIPIFLIKIWICRPIASFWDESIQHKQCFNQGEIFISISFLNVATDSIILVFPIILIWSLHLGWRTKVQVAALLSAGGCAVATTIATACLSFPFQTSVDTTSDIMVLDTMSVLELCIGLTCACAPSVNLLLRGLRRASEAQLAAQRRRSRHASERVARAPDSSADLPLDTEQATTGTGLSSITQPQTPTC